MGRILTQRFSARNDRGGNEDARAHICSHSRSCRHSISVKQAGLHLTVPSSRSLGASLIPSDWRVRMFWSYVLVCRTSNHMYVQTLPRSGYMDRHSCYMRRL